MTSCSYNAGKCVAWPGCEAEERLGLAAIRGVKATEGCWRCTQQKRCRSSTTIRLAQRRKRDTVDAQVDEEEEWIRSVNEQLINVVQHGVSV